MELTIARARQIVATIEVRKRALFRQQATLLQWQTRTLAEFIAASVPIEKGKRNPLLEQAQKVSLNLDGEDDSSQEENAPSKVEDKPEVFIEQGSSTAAERNQAGSYEALMQGLRS